MDYQEDGRPVTQNNHLVWAKLDRTQVSGIRSLTGEFQTGSGRKLAKDAAWETGTDLTDLTVLGTGPRGRGRGTGLRDGAGGGGEPEIQPIRSQPHSATPDLLDAPTCCPPAVVLWAGLGQLAVPVWFGPAPSRGSLSFSDPHGHPP